MELFLTIFYFLFSFAMVLGTVCFGWYFVWKVFLSHFRFVRELLGGMSESSGNSDGKNGGRSNRHKKPRRE